MEKVRKFLKNIKANLLQMFGSLCLLALAAAIGIYIGLDKTNSINKYVNQAFEYFAERNWDAYFSFSEVVDNDFINTHFFEEFIVKQYGEYKSDEVKLGKLDVNDDEAVVEVISTKTGEAKSWSIKFAKKYETSYAFFPQWRVDISDTIIHSSSITVPVGFDVYVDGVQLSQENTHISEEENIITYEIPRMFEGEHFIFLENENFQLVETYVSWMENNMSYELDTSLLKIKEADNDAIKADAKSIVIGMYSAIFAESGTNTLSQYFMGDEATRAMYQNIYNSMLAAIKPEDGSTLNSMEITSYNVDELTYTYGEGVDVTISFDCKFSARGKRNNVGGIRDKYEGTSSSQVKLHFDKEGDKWYCDMLDMECIDYSKKEG